MNVVSKLKWLYPGMKIKRWLLLLPIALVLIILGTILLMSFSLEQFNRVFARFCFETYGIGGNIPFFVAGLICMLVGLIIIYFIIKQILYSVVFTITGNTNNIVDIVYKKRSLVSGPRIVVIGGGTGLSTMLKGLKQYSSNITAIVTVSDNGGSSGKLKKEMGILPPGDIRNCLVALADTEDVLEPLLQYRFKDEDKTLEGHSLGNLILGALTNITGDFESAISKISDILAIRGKVYPCSTSPIDLEATFVDNIIIKGETEIVSYGKTISELKLSNEDVIPPVGVCEAIKDADLIVLGPGSLYTSVVPNLLVKDIKNALIASKAKKIYVCNVMTQAGETDGFSAFDHFKVIKKYLNNMKIDFCIVNNTKPSEDLLQFYKDMKQEYVEYNPKDFKLFDTEVVLGDYMNLSDKVRHDYEKLSKTIIGLVFDENRKNIK